MDARIAVINSKDNVAGPQQLQSNLLAVRAPLNVYEALCLHHSSHFCYSRFRRHLLVSLAVQE